jgi:hypothetical protein
VTRNPWTGGFRQLALAPPRLAQTLLEPRQLVRQKLGGRRRPELVDQRRVAAPLVNSAHGLAGDGNYGDDAMNRELRERAGLERLFLHASRIELPRPGSEETLGIDAPLAPDLARVVEALRRRG